jgi:DNA end-binding protein Ku
MRAVYTGNINFGMVSIPIKLFPTTKPYDIKFNFLCPNCHSKIKEKRFCDNCNIEIPYSELKKGFYLSKSQGYVVFDKEEIEKLKVRSNKIIDLIKFVNLEEIDNLFVEKSYYIIPEEKGIKAYSILKEVLTLTNKVGIGKITLRNREKYCFIRSYKNGLVLTIIYYPEEIYNIDEILYEQNIKLLPISKEELDFNKEIIEKLTSKFDTSEIKDTFRELIISRIKEKANFKDQTERVKEAKDLINQLTKSIETTQIKKTSRTNGKKVVKNDM